MVWLRETRFSPLLSIGIEIRVTGVNALVHSRENTCSCCVSKCLFKHASVPARALLRNIFLREGAVAPDYSHMLKTCGFAGEAQIHIHKESHSESEELVYRQLQSVIVDTWAVETPPPPLLWDNVCKKR